MKGQTEDVSFEEIPFKTVTEQECHLVKKEAKGFLKLVRMGRKKITKVYKTIKGVKTADAPTVSEEVVEQAQDQIIQKGAKNLKSLP